MGVAGGDLDDACQEVFVQVFRYLARFEQRCDFKTWLYKLCLSQSSQVRRRRKLQRALAWLLGNEGTARPAGHAWTEEMAGERVRRALDQMKPLHREVFVLFALEGVELVKPCCSPPTPFALWWWVRSSPCRVQRITSISRSARGW